MYLYLMHCFYVKYPNNKHLIKYIMYMYKLHLKGQYVVLGKTF